MHLPELDQPLKVVNVPARGKRRLPCLTSDQERAVENLSIEHGAGRLRITRPFGLAGSIFVDVLPGVSDREPSELRFLVEADGSAHRVHFAREFCEEAA